MASGTPSVRRGKPEAQALDTQALDPLMLDLLVCPVTRGPLKWREGEVVSPKARLAFPVRDGVPILVIGEAREVDEDEVKALK